jgi:hypothetical protein
VNPGISGGSTCFQEQDFVAFLAEAPGNGTPGGACANHNIIEVA